MQTLLQDLRFGARMLLKHPGFTLMAILTLGLGIGANTAIFSVVNTVLLKPAPFRDPARVVQIVQTAQGRQRVQMTPADFAAVRQSNGVFAEVGASQFFDANLSGQGLAERARGARVTANVFALLGINPVLGRWPEAREDQPSGQPVVVIGHALWLRRFGSDPNVIGKTVQLNGQAHSIIGVMPDAFRFPAPYWAPGDLWTLVGQGGINWTERKARSLIVCARLQDGVSLAQAQSAMEVLAAQMAQHEPATNRDVGLRVTNYGGPSIASSQRPLLLLFAAAGLVLLIACVNVINLLLSRSVERYKEIAIRAALGAGRMRLVRQMLTESLLLFLGGGALGLVLAMWGVELIVGLRSYDLPRMEEATVDATVAGFSLLLALVTGLVAGIFPALQYSDTKLLTALGSSGRSTGTGRGWRRLQRTLIVSEIAVALVLLVGATLLLHSFRTLSALDPGFKVEHLQSQRVMLPAQKYPTEQARATFARQLVERLNALPGVASACAVNVPPGVGAGADEPVAVWGQADATDAKSQRRAAVRQVSPEYFRTLEIPLRQGRALTATDNFDSPRVALINETMARQLFSAQAALGQRVRWPVESATAAAWEIVGVVADAKEDTLLRPAPPTLYLPLAQAPPRQLALLVRSPQDVTVAVRRELAALDSDLPLWGIRPMTFMLASEYDLQRLSLALFGVFAVVALVLALIGIYGVIAYSVNQRTREIGLRMALGADRRAVLGLILREGMWLAVWGIGVGAASALGLTRFLASLLFGVSATDPLTFVGVALLLAAIAALACWLPARRAMQVDPMIALRCE